MQEIKKKLYNQKRLYNKENIERNSFNKLSKKESANIQRMEESVSSQRVILKTIIKEKICENLDFPDLIGLRNSLDIIA